MSAAVTGASGFFGKALVRALRDRGDSVRALVRRNPAADELRALGVEPVRGDLTDPQGCAALVRAGDTVFHAAARVDVHGRWEEFRRTTVEGTGHLLAAALPQRPRRFVYISSGAVYQTKPGADGFSAARTPARPPGYNFYGRAKLEAERLVQVECARAGCPWTILRLGFLYGAGNLALLRHFVPLAKRNRIYVIGRGDNRIATLYIDDAVRATLLAAADPAAENQTYDVASEEPVTQRQFLDATIDALGLACTPRRTIRPLAFVCAWLVERLGSWTNHDVHISRTTVALMSADQVVDAGRIRTELGWRPEVSFEEGMRRAREWHRRLPAEEPAGDGNRAPVPAARSFP